MSQKVVMLGAVCLLSSGCSLIIGPDEKLLPGGGGGTDAGPRPDTGGSDPDTGSVDPDAGTRDAGCSSKPACVDGRVVRCVGGEIEEEVCPLGCAPGGEPRCGRMRPSNVESSLFDAMARDVRLAGASEYVLDTSTCMATMTETHLVPQEDGPELCVLLAHDMVVDATLRVRGSRPLVVLASGTVRIAGTIDVSADGVMAGPGGGAGAQTAEMVDGEGPAGGRGGAHVDDFDDGGGAGGALCGAGGGGGHGGSAAGAEQTPAFRRDWLLQPLAGGSGGGRGRGTFTSGSTLAGLGGGGGGALQISSLESIEIGGRILAGGGGGLGGRNSFRDNWGSGGGGGSGGAILLEAPVVTVDGDVLASGGGGGGGAGAPMSGGMGENGRGVAGRAGGGVRGDMTYGAGGGDSGGAGDLAGADGETQENGSGNGGGGGGGAGCIVIRNADGMLPGGGATYSPDVEPGLRRLPVLVE